MFVGSVESHAQQIKNPNHLDVRITHFANIQSSFAPGSAKYDLVQNAIDYLGWIKTNVQTNPHFLDGMAPIMQSNQIRKSHPTILANYTPAQLAAYQADYNQMVGEGQVATSSVHMQKLQWILEANAY